MEQTPQFETPNTKTATRKHQDQPIRNSCSKGLSKQNFITQELRPTAEKWDLIKLKSICTVKETIS